MIQLGGNNLPDCCKEVDPVFQLQNNPNERRIQKY